MSSVDRSRSPLRVLFVQGHLRENGGLRVVNALAGRFTADGVRTGVFALEEVDDDAVALPAPEVPLHYGAHHALPAARRLPAGVLALLRTARDYDVVVSGSEIGHGLLAAALVARTLRRPFVILAQGELEAALQAWVPPRLREATRRVHRHADAVVAVSPGLVPGLLANGLPADRVHVVVNGVDVDELHDRAVADRTAPDPRRRTGPGSSRSAGSRRTRVSTCCCAPRPPSATAGWSTTSSSPGRARTAPPWSGSPPSWGPITSPSPVSSRTPPPCWRRPISSCPPRAPRRCR